MPEDISKRTARKNKYNAKTYDRIEYVVPKGRKAAMVAHAQSKGLSLTSYLNSLVDFDMGEWNPPDSPSAEQED